MMAVREPGDDLVHDIIKKLILQVEGVADASIQRTWDGFHLVVTPRPGQLDEPLMKDIQSTLEKNFPPLAQLFHVSIESPESKTAGILLERPRIELEQVNLSSNPDRRFSITVRLRRRGSAPVEVSKQGTYHIENVIRLAAEATLEGAIRYFPEQTDGMVLGTRHLEIAYENLVVVLVTLNLKQGQVTASGSASMKKGSHFGAVTATLKAVNRYLEFYDMD